MNILSRIAFSTSGFVIMLCLSYNEVALSAGSSQTLYKVNDYLPVSSEGYRYTSVPYGELLGILKVVQQIKAHGTHQRISSRGIDIPNKSENRVVSRYDYTFPANCGGVSFNYYEGENFAALGYVNNGTVILDVLQGGSPFTAPRLWGPYDQVLNDETPMVTVVSFNGENGSGLMTASFMAGMVTGMSRAKQEHLGNAYSEGIYSASRCTRSTGTTNLLVTK